MKKTVIIAVIFLAVSIFIDVVTIWLLIFGIIFIFIPKIMYALTKKNGKAIKLNLLKIACYGCVIVLSFIGQNVNITIAKKRTLKLAELLVPFSEILGVDFPKLKSGFPPVPPPPILRSINNQNNMIIPNGRTQETILIQLVRSWY